MDACSRVASRTCRCFSMTRRVLQVVPQHSHLSQVTLCLAAQLAAGWDQDCLMPNRGHEELPTSVIIVLTRCYSPSCSEFLPCYSFACPRRPKVGVIKYHSGASLTWLDQHRRRRLPSKRLPLLLVSLDEEWTMQIDPAVLAALPGSEVNRQTIIHTLISKEI